jgi:hypothetical protein
LDFGSAAADLRPTNETTIVHDKGPSPAWMDVDVLDDSVLDASIHHRKVSERAPRDFESYMFLDSRESPRSNRTQQVLKPSAVSSARFEQLTNDLTQDRADQQKRDGDKK